MRDAVGLDQTKNNAFFEPPRGEQAMALELNTEAGGKILQVQVGGKLETADYERFVPEVERQVTKYDRVCDEKHWASRL